MNHNVHLIDYNYRNLNIINKNIMYIQYVNIHIFIYYIILKIFK